MLRSLGEISNYAYLPPALPLGLIFLSLFLMLFVSSLVTAAGVFFLSDDLDLILSTPVTFPRFFFGRFFQVVIGTTWMPAIFILPVVVAYGVWFQKGLLFYAVSIAGLIPYFLIPCAAAAFVATILLTLVPAHRARGLLLLVFALFMGCIYLIVDLLRAVLNASENSTELLKIISILSVSNIPWSPSSWLSGLFRELLQGSFGAALWLVLLLYLTLCALLSLAYIASRLFHFHAYSHASNTKRARKIFSRDSQAWASRYLGVLPSWARGMLIKDLKVVGRDVTQLVQLILLGGIYLLYIYNLRVYVGFHQLAGTQDPWWRNFLFVSNFCMAAFITSALCTRFVFPSISLEGRGFWILLTAPMSLASYVGQKFRFWFAPVAAIGVAVSCSGIFAIGAGTREIIVNGIATSVVCYGLSGLATGFGAAFARFDWESPSQLAVGFGNLVFMLTGTVLILLNLLPVWSLVFVYYPPEMGLMPWLRHYLIHGGSLLLLNVASAQLAIRFGRRALLKRVS